MSQELGEPGRIGFVGLSPRSLPDRARIGNHNLQCFNSHMVDRFPVHPGTLHHRDGAALHGEPGPKGQQFVVRGATVTPRGVNRAILTGPAQTRGQLRRMPINTTAHGMHNLPDVALLNHNHNNGGGRQGSGS